MIHNYLTIAFRNLSKNRLFSLLNIGGLSTGLAVAMLIGLYVRDEMSFDQFNEKADRIYRVNFDLRFGGKEEALAVASAPFGPTIVRDYPAVEAMCRFRQWGFITVKKGNEAIEEGFNTYVDSTFFSVFSMPLLEGDPKTALTEPGTGVISEKMAQKYFGATTGIVGRTLRINENRDMRVTGVMRDMPSQSHFHYNFLFSMASIAAEANEDLWLSNNFQTYLLLRPGASEADLESRINEVIEKYVGPQFEKITGGTMAAFKASGDWLKYSLMNIRDIHLYSDRTAEQEANSDIKYVWIFSLVALMVLLLACVNFMNLSTARSTGRAREVGVRKALGSNRGALVRQFLTESLVLTVLSFAVASLAVWLILPSFNDFAAKDIRFSLLDVPMLGALAGLALFTAFIAGSYPAFFLSAFKPIEVLKGKLTLNTKGGASWLRSGLVVFQFFISVALIASVLVVQKQLDFIQNKKLGYDKEHLVMLRNTWWLREKTLDFKSRLLQIPGIENVSCADNFPTPSSRNNTTFTKAGMDISTASISSEKWAVDFDYLRTFGLKLQEGRWFDAALKTDSSVCVINQAAAKAFGWFNPVGQKISTFTNAALQEMTTMEIVGVVQDFNYESLRENIGPMVMTIGDGSGTMALRLARNADIEKTMAAVGGLFKAALPAQPFNFRFVDEEFDQQYRAEQRIGSILGAFAGFAIFIACLGLFGLATFTAEQRTKEIGIRKVLGASVAGITGLLARDFLKLVFIAIVLASPVAYYLMQRWLADFAYRIDIQGWMFVATGVGAALVAFLTVSFQSVKAALANPVKSLRSE
ncbi:MAG: ABC transporter permease [Saprospiraceae bacterium]|nr:ABC transporter permease [Saprospiraceae bacterium]